MTLKSTTFKSNYENLDKMILFKHTIIGNLEYLEIIILNEPPRFQNMQLIPVIKRVEVIEMGQQES